MTESLVFVNGRVCTMDVRRQWADAVVVRDERIVYVGDEAGAREHVGRDTEVVDLGGGMLLPGFIDAHDHLACLASILKVGVDIRGITDPQEMVRVIGEYARANPELEVIRGYGFVVAQFPGHSPRRELLDQAVPDRPAFIYSYDIHDGWFNTAAMRAVGLDANTPDPDPGSQYFVREADGTPTGHTVEGANRVLLNGLGQLSLGAVIEGQKQSLDPAPSWGITTYFEAGVLLGSNAAAEPVYLDLVERDLRGDLPVRVVGSVWTREATDDPLEVVATLREWNQRIRSKNLTITTIKMYSDGTMMSGGALLLEPMCGHDSLGSMTFPPEAIYAQVEAAHLAGFDVHVHVEADGSVRTVLDAIEKVQRRHGRRGRRHTICHLTLVHPDDVPRFAELGVIANVQPMWGTNFDGVHVELYPRLLGQARASRVFPYADLIRSGATVTYGADCPGVAIDEIAPLKQIEAALTRRRPGHPDEPCLFPEQRVGLHDALRAMTIDAAYQLHLEHDTGTIEVGKRADLVALAANLYDLPDHQIHQTPITLTTLNGHITHHAL